MVKDMDFYHSEEIYAFKRFGWVKVYGKKLIKENDLSDGQYSVNKNIRFKTLMLRLDLRDYIDVYIAVRVRSVIGNNNDSRENKKHNKVRIMQHLDNAQ